MRLTRTPRFAARAGSALRSPALWRRLVASQVVCLGLACLGLAGCGARDPLADVPDEALAERFREMHRRVYGVYALGPQRDAVHALLAGSFVGDALTGEYVEHFTTLARMQEENIAIDVRRVDYESIELVERTEAGARIEAEWSVGGVVRHQAHRHPRINRYRAVYTLRPAGETADLDSLRIVDTRLRSLERVRSAFDGMGGFPLDDLPESGGGLLSTRDLLESGLADELLVDEEPPP